MNEHYFLVTCRGQCATRWLAKALSEIDGVRCSHGPGEPWISLDFNRKMTPDERRKNIEEVIPKRMATMGVGAVFEELRAQGDGQYFGNVHMFTLPALDLALRRYGGTHPYQIANLIRHPITWIESSTHNKIDAISASPQLKERFEAFYVANREICDALTRPYGVNPLDPIALCFLNTALGSWPGFAEELSWMGIRHIRMEDITKHPSSFKTVASHLLGKDIVITSDDLDRIFSMGRVNRHSKRRSLSPEQQYRAWPQWKQKTVRLIWEKIPQVQAFKTVGYDFSFLERRSVSQRTPRSTMAEVRA